MKKLLSAILTATLIFTTVAVPVFADTNENVASEVSTLDTASESAEDIYETGGSEQAPTEYIDAESFSTEEEIALYGSVSPNSLQECGENATWTLDDGVLTISGSGNMSDFDGEEDAPWDDVCYKIGEVIVEDGVTSIGAAAFYNAYNLEKVTLADSVKVLGYGAFAYCRNLTTFSAPGLTEIEDYAFNETGLTEFTVPAGVQTIGSLAFIGTPIENYSVESGNKVFSAKSGVLYKDGGKTLFAYPSGNENVSFVIPSTVTKVADGTFMTNRNLKSIEIPDSVVSLGESAFRMCKSLKSIVIPDSVTEVGDFTFYECSALEDVTLGKGIKVTSYLMFEDCSSLKNIDFGSGLEEIYARTFSYCTSLENIVIPANVKTIGNGAFGECTGLKSVTTKGIEDCIPYQAFFNCKKLESVTLNEGIKNIYDLSFYGCTALKELYLPNSVKYIAEEAIPVDTVLKNLDPNMETFGINGYRTVQRIYFDVLEKYSSAYAVLDRVNAERAKVGAEPLVMNESLMESAMQRAAECAVMFSHTRPSGDDCFDINELMYGENIAMGSTTAKGVMNQWMNSAGHKANILSESFTTIGIGCVVHADGYYWVQCFGIGDDTVSCAKPADKIKEASVALTLEPIEDDYVPEPMIFIEEPEIKLGDSTTAGVFITNAICKNKEITWSSDNNNVATVTADGEIKAVGYGTATITAKLKHYTLSEEITVTCPGHTYKTTTTKATPILDGKVVKECTICGKTTTKNISAPTTIKLSYTSTTYTGKAKKPSVKVYDREGEKVSDSNYKVTYASGRKKVGQYKVTVAFKGNYTGSETLYFTILPKAPSSASATLYGHDDVKFSWKKSTGAKGYKVYYKESSADEYTYLTSTTKTYVKKADLAEGVSYKFKVVPYYKLNGITYDSLKYKTDSVYTLKKLDTPIVSKSGTKVKVKWSNISGESGYQISKSTKETGTKIVSTYKTTKGTYKTFKATKGKTYYYKVRAYKTVSGKKVYGPWSDVVSFVR